MIVALNHYGGCVCDIYKAFYGRLHIHTFHTFTVHVTDVCKRICVTAVFNACYGVFRMLWKFVNGRACYSRLQYMLWMFWYNVFDLVHAEPMYARVVGACKRACVCMRVWWVGVSVCDCEHVCYYIHSPYLPNSGSSCTPLTSHMVKPLVHPTLSGQRWHHGRWGGRPEFRLCCGQTPSEQHHHHSHCQSNHHHLRHSISPWISTCYTDL